MFKPIHPDIAKPARLFRLYIKDSCYKSFTRVVSCIIHVLANFIHQLCLVTNFKCTVKINKLPSRKIPLLLVIPGAAKNKRRNTTKEEEEDTNFDTQSSDISVEEISESWRSFQSLMV